MMNDGNIVQLGEFSQTTETTTPTHPKKKHGYTKNDVAWNMYLLSHKKRCFGICIVYCIPFGSNAGTNQSQFKVGCYSWGSFGSWIIWGEVGGSPGVPSLLG